MDFEAPLTSLVWITSIVSIILTFIVTYLMIPTLGDGTLWWKLASIISCGTLAGAIIPELVKVFTSTNSAHVKEVVKSAQEGGASLGILSGFVAGNFSAYWLGLSMVALMSLGYYFSTGRVHGGPDAGSGRLRVWPGRLRLPGHGSGDDCRGFLRAGYRQCSIRLRVVADRKCSRHRSRVEEGLQLRREVRTRKAPAGSQRWSRQHLQGFGQAGADRHRRGGRNHDDLLDHHGPDPRTDP